MPEPTDADLYESVKSKLYREMPEHSAYRSGILVQKYKKAYAEKHSSGSPYKGSKGRGKLSRWFKEDWRTQSGSKTYQKKGDVFRPTKRVTKDTPLTFNELSKSEIESAKKEKKTKGRVKDFRPEK